MRGGASSSSTNAATWTGLRADELGDDAPVAEPLHRRDALYAVRGRQALVGVDVHLHSGRQLRRAARPPRPGRGRARGRAHQAAQKSTITGVSRERSTTSCSKVFSVTSM